MVSRDRSEFMVAIISTIKYTKFKEFYEKSVSKKYKNLYCVTVQALKKEKKNIELSKTIYALKIAV